MSTSTEAEKLRPESVLLIRLIGLIALMACLSALAVGPASEQIGRIRDTVSDIYQRMAPRQPPEEFPALIVTIDQASLDAVGPWPWPRAKIAELTERLFELKAQVVGYDIVFSEPDRFGGENLARIYHGEPEEVRQQLLQLADPDERLISVVSGAGNYVVVGRAGVGDPADGSSPDPSAFPIEATFDGDRPQNLRFYPSALTNIADLDEVALGHGLLNGEPDGDGIIRRVPLVAMLGKRLAPSFALELIRVAAVSSIAQSTGGAGKVANPDIKLHVENGRLTSLSYGHFRVPVEADGTMRIHFSRPVKGRTVSAHEILDGKVDPIVVGGKLVIVGFTGIGIEDVVPTPLYSENSGVDIHAQVIEAFFYDGWLSRPYWAPALEWACAALLGLVALLGLPLLSPGRAVIVSLVAAIFVVSFSVGAFAFSSLVLDATLPLMGAGIPATIVMAGILLSTERRRRELRSIVQVEEARAEEAQKIQFAMLPTADSLRALPAGVDVWPVLEPAQSVGGDFYDAFMLDDTRLYFTVGDVTGKGVSAALFMSVVKALSKSLILRDGGALDRAVVDISREVSRDNPDEMFATALLGVMDVTSGHVAMCNAGHENPIIVRKDGTAELWSMDGGPPFCVMDDFPYPVETMRLEPGEALVIITDGVSEAWSPKDELFGRERVLDVFAKLPSSAPSEEIVNRLTKAVRVFENKREPVDDLTIMAIGYRRGSITGQ